MKSYQTWFDLEEKKLKNWWQFYPKSEFYRKTIEGKLLVLEVFNLIRIHIITMMMEFIVYYMVKSGIIIQSETCKE
jgi:hypothetical protein